MNLGDLNKVWEIKALKRKPGEEEAKKMLDQIAKQVQPIMRKRKWRVKVLSEFCPTNPSLLGVNVGRGVNVKLRLRRPNRDWDFIPYDQVLDTMLHELCHNAHGPHNADFYRLWDELRKECEELISKGITGTGEGFDVQGKRLGGFSRQPPLSSLNKTALAAAEKRAKLGSMLPSGPKRLGGDSTIMGALSPIQAAAMAAERRLRDEIWCASQFVDISEDGESSTDIAEDFVDMVQPTGHSIPNKGQKRNYGQNSRPSPFHGCPESKTVGLSADVSTSGSTFDDETKRIKRTCNLEKNASSGSSFVDLTGEPSLLSTPHHDTGDLAMWECGVCTLLNPPLAPICDMCCTEKPKDASSKYKMWACKFCTLENSVKLDKCSACDQWRYSNGPPLSTPPPNLGDLQSTVLAMRDCASEVSVALSAFGRVSRGQTALTSESGTMLDEVLAITEDLHDVHTLGKEAAAVHRSLMQDLSKANAILLPLESVLSKDVTAMTDAITRETETKMEVSPIHGQAIYQSYCSRIREAIQTFKPLLPSLTLSVKGLYLILIRLARSASLHAGNLHKALEGLAESQDVKSQEISLSRSDLDSGGDEFDKKERDSLSRSESGSSMEILGDNELPSQDKGWISPPDSIYSHSSESGIMSAEACLLDRLGDPAEEMQQFSHGYNTDYINSGHSSQIHHQELSGSGQSMIKSDEVNSSDYSALAPCSELIEQSTVFPSDKTVSVHIESFQSQNGESSKLKIEDKDYDLSLSSKVKIEDETREALQPNLLSTNRVARGKNPYAVSVLRRVEMKIDGRDISERREISIAEQVDYLIKQATSVDNLCNMYEGWTPWI